ncbi:MAG TPA: flagellin [Planctomycetota bacterium]|jgi:flagellin|nr:flagellin [Planctomycetota bacterium]
MSLVINTNLASLNARGSLDTVSNRLEKNFAHLSTGLRITTAADDAAGLAISERMRAQIRSLSQAQRNANDGISMVQVGEGAMNEMDNILIRMRELAIESNNGTVSASDKDTLNDEFTSLIAEIDRIAQATQFNGVNLLNGSTANVVFQVGANNVTNVDTLSVGLVSVLASDLGISALDISSAGSATTAIAGIDAAINVVVASRGDLGALQNRLQSTITNLGVSVENLTAAESRIRDVDVAAETAELTRNSILQQASISVLAQANVQPQNALKLLQNLG